MKKKVEEQNFKAEAEEEKEKFGSRIKFVSRLRGSVEEIERVQMIPLEKMHGKFPWDTEERLGKAVEDLESLSILFKPPSNSRRTESLHQNGEDLEEEQEGENESEEEEKEGNVGNGEESEKEKEIENSKSKFESKKEEENKPGEDIVLDIRKKDGKEVEEKESLTEDTELLSGKLKRKKKRKCCLCF